MTAGDVFAFAVAIVVCNNSALVLRGRHAGPASRVRRSRATSASTIPHSRAGHGVLLKATVNAEVERRVVLLVASGELDGIGGQCRAGAAGDLNLSAADLC
jgi:hypothetical protein